MSVITPVYQVEPENKTAGNFLKKAGKYGMALSIFGSVPAAVFVAYVNDSPIPSSPLNIKMSSGLSSGSLSNPIEKEMGSNQFSYSTAAEYVKSNFITLNGSLLEANNAMENDPEIYGNIYNEDVVFDFSFEPTPKKVFKLPSELTIIKKATPDYQYYADDFLQDEVSFEPTPKRTFKL